MKHILLEASDILNKKFHVIPLLYGSYALQEVLNKDYQARDIDLLIDQTILKNKLEIISAFLMKGYTYIKKEVLTFEKEGIEVEISNLEQWIKNTSFIIEENIFVQHLDTKYFLLSADNLLRLYHYLYNDPRRSNEKKLKDREKLADLKTFLER